MSEPVRVRRLTDEEGHKLQRLVRRGEGKGKASVVRYRRGLVVLSSATADGALAARQAARAIRERLPGTRVLAGRPGDSLDRLRMLARSVDVADSAENAPLEGPLLFRPQARR